MSLIDKCSLQAGDKRMDVESYMTLDHFETNGFIKYILRQIDDYRDVSEFLRTLSDRLRRHIYIEEVFLFPKLGPESQKDVEYIKKEHGKLFRMLDLILKERSNLDKIKEVLENLLDLLIEHYGYEESFIYDHFNNLDADIISGLKYPKGWEPKYFGDGDV